MKLLPLKLRPKNPKMLPNPNVPKVKPVNPVKAVIPVKPVNIGKATVPFVKMNTGTVEVVFVEDEVEDVEDVPESVTFTLTVTFGVVEVVEAVDGKLIPSSVPRVKNSGTRRRKSGVKSTSVIILCVGGE